MELDESKGEGRRYASLLPSSPETICKMVSVNLLRSWSPYLIRIHALFPDGFTHCNVLLTRPARDIRTTRHRPRVRPSWVLARVLAGWCLDAIDLDHEIAHGWAPSVTVPHLRTPSGNAANIGASGVSILVSGCTISATGRHESYLTQSAHVRCSPSQCDVIIPRPGSRVRSVRVDLALLVRRSSIDQPRPDEIFALPSRKYGRTSGIDRTPRDASNPQYAPWHYLVRFATMMS